MRRTHIRVARLSAVRPRVRVALDVQRRPEGPAEEHDAHDLSRGRSVPAFLGTLGMIQNAERFQVERGYRVIFIYISIYLFIIYNEWIVYGCLNEQIFL